MGNEGRFLVWPIRDCAKTFDDSHDCHRPITPFHVAHDSWAINDPHGAREMEVIDQLGFQGDHGHTRMGPYHAF